MRPSARLFHAITVKDYTWEPQAGDRGIEWYEASGQRFLERLGSHADPRGKTILDAGCGSGELTAMLARDGAERVVGVDIHLPDGVRERLVERYGEEAMAKVELVQTDGSLDELGDERFDLVISKEAMEHYDDPEGFVAQVIEYVKPGGLFAIGFGPLWKAFDGAHMGFMTRVPWAHLIFPEDVIMAERRRFRPEEPATRFEDIQGGLNKMTLARFEAIMAGTGFEPVYVRRNAGDHPAVKVMDRIARIRPLREYFTNNVYGVWRRPE